MVSRPKYVEKCDSKQRIFPESWKTAYWRLHGGPDQGYQCPECKIIFTGSKGFSQLHADHIEPYGNGGLTTWENMQLLCKECNWRKGNNSL